MDYKDTLLMPNTTFEMRGNLPKKEPGIQQKWEEMRLYDRMVAMNEGLPLYVLHDGPPYANGNLHMGTAMNRCLKDFVVKSKHMSGHQISFYPGWDTHGLPIENAMPKLGYDRKKMSTADFRAKCEEYALQQIEIQKTTEKRLGTVADFDHPYITLQKTFEADQIRTFGKMALKGLIFQGMKPIYWSPERESAVADSEIEYHDKKDPTVFVTFDVKDGKGVLDGDEKFVIWTTTPWTLPGNTAITLHPQFEYAVVKCEKGKLIMLKSLVETLMQKFGIENYEIIKTYKGKDLEYVTCRHVLYPEEKETLVCNADYVTDEDGTGCVHTAGGHGLDDFMTTTRYGLPAFCPVDERGCMTEEAGEWLKGQFVFDANKTIVVKLEEIGHLLKMEWITHSYPHDERMKKPVIFRATTQWFASIEKIKDQLLKAVDNTTWHNEWGHTRIYNMIKDRKDWCISRQRVWGVPIPIFYDEAGKPIIEEAVFEHVAQLFEQFGSNVWFEREAKDLLPEGYTNPGSPNGRFTKETDIMDVWFDSGSSHNTFARRGLPYPCDLYLEGSDQYRGWFNSSLSVGVATHDGVAPYKAVLSHGYVVDGKGMAMHKSVGNTVDPMKVMQVYGADILRLWATLVDFKQDMRCSDDILKQDAEFYKKVRNTFRYLLGNCNRVTKKGEKDFVYEEDRVPYEKLESLDQYIIVLLNDIIEKVRNAYDSYNFIVVSTTMINFMTNVMSAFYMDYAKDILYIEKLDSLRRRQVQTVFYEVTDALVRLWAPILSFTSEEIYSMFKPEVESVFLTQFPEVVKHENAAELKSRWGSYMKVRDDILKALEEARNSGLIGKALEAKIYLKLKDEYRNAVEGLSDHDLAQLVIVSQFELTEEENTEYDTGWIKVEKFDGCTCPRCWNVVSHVDEDGLCDRCHYIVK